MYIEDKPEGIVQLYESVCKFNYFQDLDIYNQPIKVNIELDQLPRKISEEFRNVPLHFSSSHSYTKFWKPLFIQQLKGYVISAKATEGFKPQKCQLLSYYELGIFKVMQFKKMRETETTFNQGGLIALSPQKKLSQDKDYPHLIGVIHRIDNNIFVRVILDQKRINNTESFMLLTNSKQWFLQFLCPLNSIQRQYKALSTFEKINPLIKEIILKPNSNKAISFKKFHIPTELESKLYQIFNSSQLEAISSSLKQEGITLIQGPPGTGKTKTVLGTISVLLQSSINREQDQQIPLLLRWKTSEQNIKHNVEDLNPWIKSNFVDWRDQPILSNQLELLNLTKFYQTTKRQIHLVSRRQQSTAPSKVLVCGPSNASVDQVIRKLLSEKLLDGSGKNYLPSFVRVGQNYHQSLQQYSLDYLTNKNLKKQKLDLYSMKKKILKDSRLVFTTLSSSGSGVLQNADIQFDTVIIDQAGQSIQILNLIPLAYGCKRLILIGDPKQLPATVFSPVCLQNHYDQSLFQRLMKNQYPINLLRIQYRMHPHISRVIGKNFYQNMLENGSDMQIQPKNMPKAFIMLHVDTSSQIIGEQSFYNPVQGQCVKIIANWIAKDYNDIGILSPYSAQVKWLNQQKINKCEIKTIDSFQGRQKQAIIFSSVRANLCGRDKQQNKKRTIGFVGDGRRLNVALSRAKNLCIVVGDMNRLQMSKIWKGIITQSKKNGQVYKVSCAQQLRQIGQGFLHLKHF